MEKSSSVSDIRAAGSQKGGFYAVGAGGVEGHGVVGAWHEVAQGCLREGEVWFDEGVALLAAFSRPGGRGGVCPHGLKIGCGAEIEGFGTGFGKVQLAVAFDLHDVREGEVQDDRQHGEDDEEFDEAKTPPRRTRGEACEKGFHLFTHSTEGWPPPAGHDENCSLAWAPSNAALDTSSPLPVSAA